MTFKATFVFSVVTPESAESGEFDRHGWITPGHWEYPLQDSDGHHDDVLVQAQAGEFDVTDIGEALWFAAELGINSDAGNWLETSDGVTEDYSTGETWSYAMHIEGVTPSTYNRIRRLLGD